MIPSFNKFIDDNFLNAEAIGPPGAFIVVTIKDLDYADAYNQRIGKKEKVPVVYFEGDTKPMIPNKGNRKMLKRLFSPGEDKPEKCVGKTIEVYVVDTKVGGQPTTGMRIREHVGVKCESCGKEIRPTATRTVDQLVEISKRNTGKVLCVDCMRKFAEEQKKEEEKSE